MSVGGVKAEFQTFLPPALEGCKCLASRYITVPLGKRKKTPVSTEYEIGWLQSSPRLAKRSIPLPSFEMQPSSHVSNHCNISTTCVCIRENKL